MATDRRRRCHPRLDRLTDSQLHALLVRAQTLLLDRPQGYVPLTVDLLSADEARLLALYRRLPSARRHEELARIERAAATPTTERDSERAAAMPTPPGRLRTRP